MKAKQKQINLIEGGRDEWERTEQYKEKAGKIITEVNDRYAKSLSAEKNWIKKLMMKARIEIEIKKKMDEISSSENLHTSGDQNFG